MGAPLYYTIGILSTKESFYNKETLSAHNHIMKRLVYLTKVAVEFDKIAAVRGDSPEYPFYEVFEMLKHTLTH